MTSCEYRAFVVSSRVVVFARRSLGYGGFCAGLRKFGIQMVSVSRRLELRCGYGLISCRQFDETVTRRMGDGNYFSG